MRRTIVYSDDFDECVERLGGYRAIDQAIDIVIDGLSRDPFGYDKFESDDFSFRYARTRPIGDVPELWIRFTTTRTKQLRWTGLSL